MKKVISILLVVVLSLGCIACADESDTRFGVLKAFGIMEGDGNGNLNLDKYVTRAEFTKMAVAASQYRNAVASTLSVSPFPDVTYKMWHAPYVYVGVSNGILQGYKDGTFKPDGNVLYEEAATILLRLLGYQDSEFAYSWPTGQIGMAERIGLCDDVFGFAGQALTRNQVSHMFYNLLDSQTKQGIDYTASLEHSVLKDVVITASHLQEDTLEKGYVKTTAGVYQVSDSFDYSHVGSKGDAVIKNKMIVSFIPDNTFKTVYNVYSVSGQNLILFKNGSVSDYKLKGSEILYYDGMKTTVSAMIQSFAPGDIIELHSDSTGKLQYVTYSENTLEGPIVIKSDNWYKNTGLTDNAFVVKNGQTTTLSSLENYDVVYYSAELQTVWASGKKVSGIYEEALPNADQISQIKLSGVTYNIDSVDAFIKLSSGGIFKQGDSVTLLLDRDGNVCDVISPDDSREELIAYMLSGGSKEYTNPDGNSYSSYYVTLLKPDGTTLEYESTMNYANYCKDTVVKVTFKNGKASLTQVSANGDIWGKVSASNYKIGADAVDKDVKIVDVVKGSTFADAVYKRIYLQRIDGITISAQDVLFVGKNAKGEITTLFLDNLTGDAYSYGIVTKAQSSSGSMNVSGSYTYFDKSRKMSVNTSGKSFTVYAGSPVQIKNTKMGVENMKKIESAGSVTNIENGFITASGKTYLASDEVAIYNYVGTDYQAITEEELKNLLGKKTVTAYTENVNSKSPRIRVIVAK